MIISPHILAVAAAALFLKAAPLPGAEFTWDGDGAMSEDWTTANNWAGDLAPPLDGTADVTFAGTTNLAPNANLDWSIRSLTFAGGAASFIVQGKVLTLGAGGIVNADDSVQTVQNNLVLAVSQTFSTASTGSLRLNGNIDTNGRVLTVSAAADFIALAGAITGSGALVANGGESVVLTGDMSNSYTGGTTVNGSITLAKTGGATGIPGALVIGNASGSASVAIGFDEQVSNTSSITVNPGATLSLGSGVTETIAALTLTSGLAQIGSGTLRVGSVALTGSDIASGANGKLILTGDLLASAAGPRPSTISGSLNLSGAARTFTVSDGPPGSELEIRAAISNGSVIKDGPGKLRLTGVQNYASLFARAGLVSVETAVGTGAASVSVSPFSGTATVDFHTDQRLAALTIGDGGVVTLSQAGSFAQAQGGGGDFEKSPEARSVPEPSGALLILVAALALFAGHRPRWGNGRGERI